MQDYIKIDDNENKLREQEALLKEYREFFNNPKITFKIIQKEYGINLLVGTLVLPESGDEIEMNVFIDKDEFDRNDKCRNSMFLQVRDKIGLKFIRRFEMIE